MRPSPGTPTSPPPLPREQGVAPLLPPRASCASGRRRLAVLTGRKPAASPRRVPAERNRHLHFKYYERIITAVALHPAPELGCCFSSQSQLRVVG